MNISDCNCIQDILISEMHYNISLNENMLEIFSLIFVNNNIVNNTLELLRRCDSHKVAMKDHTHLVAIYTIAMLQGKNFGERDAH